MEERFMTEAIRLARKAEKELEVPVGAVIVRDGEIIAKGRNRRETKGDALAHAEMEAISRACKRLGGWRLSGCDIYVTLEPCIMCAGAILNSRIDNVYFGAYDEKAGAFGSKTNANEFGLNHRAYVVGGIMENECASLLKDFFRKRRQQP